MDFFQRQEDARRATRRLVVLFVLAVVGVVAAVNLAASLILLSADANAATAQEVFRPEVALAVTAITLVIVGGGSLYKIASLRSGGPAVAQLLGGTPLDPATRDPASRRLLNVVEEMALAAGTAVPSAYVLEKEDGINAFAAGFSADDAVIGITRGALDLLDRDELQGVVGHELSHLLNGDMRLNVRLMGLLHGILVIGQIGYWILRSAGDGRGSSRRKKGGGGAILLFGVALLVIGYVGVFFAKLIKSGVSRQREFLADAAAAQFTRDPLGLAGALKKIGGTGGGSRLSSPNAEQASHLFFGNGVGETMFAWMQTHPPLAERIRRLDPSFDGVFPAIERPARPLAPRPSVPPVTSRLRAPAGTAGAQLLAAESALATVGNPTPAHVAYAASLRDRLPSGLREWVRDPRAARAVVCALLLSREPSVRSAQLVELAAQTDDPLLLDELRKVLPLVETCAAETRLPLLDLSVPALRLLSARQWQAFERLVTRLVEADQRLDVFELALRRVLIRHVEPAFASARRRAAQFYSLQRHPRECSILLSALAWRGGSTAAGGGEAGARDAFGRGAGHLPGVALELRPDGECGAREVEDSLRALDGAAPKRKQDLLTACAVVIAHDRQVTVEEGELLRALADALECPMPPLLPGESLSAV
jgi:Zn-dependent protease with chaperone function